MGIVSLAGDFEPRGMLDAMIELLAEGINRCEGHGTRREGNEDGWKECGMIYVGRVISVNQ